MPDVDYHGSTHGPKAEGGTDPIPTGGSVGGGMADVSYHGWTHRPKAAGGTDPIPGVDELPRNLGQLGSSIATTLAATKTHTVDIQNVPFGDGVLVLAMAPSFPVAAGTIGVPTSCTDTAGNTYTLIHTSKFEAAVPAVNVGAVCALFFCQSSVATLVDGTDTITVTWNNAVYDRGVIAWLVRHDGGANTPTILAATADNNAAVYAAANVTLAVPAWTPARGNAFVFALILSFRALAGGGTAFGGIGGWSGFYEAGDISVLLTGSKEQLHCHQQTHGADVYIQVGTSITTNEIDLAIFGGGVLQAGFNGAAQAYYRPFPTPETNVWKGIILLGLD